MPIYQNVLSPTASMYRELPGSHGTKQTQSWFSWNVLTFLQISEIISPGDSGASGNVFGFKRTWWIFLPWILPKFFALTQTFHFCGITWRNHMESQGVHYLIKHLIRQRCSITQEWCFGQIPQCRKSCGGCLRELNDLLSLDNQEKRATVTSRDWKVQGCRTEVLHGDRKKSNQGNTVHK